MEDNSKKTWGFMASVKNDFEQLANMISTVEKQIDDELKSSLSKSSSLIKFNSLVKEISLSTQIVLDIYAEGQDSALVQKLISSIRFNIYELRNLLIKDIQKSMLQAVEGLAAAENGLILVNEIENMSQMFYSMSKGFER
jgi:hypothetical protein